MYSNLYGVPKSNNTTYLFVVKTGHATIILYCYMLATKFKSPYSWLSLNFRAGYALFAFDSTVRGRPWSDLNLMGSYIRPIFAGNYSLLVAHPSTILPKNYSGASPLVIYPVCTTFSPWCG